MKFDEVSLDHTREEFSCFFFVGWSLEELAAKEDYCGELLK